MVSERSGERVGPAAEQKPVTQELLDEARRYETLARITGWPIVSNTAQSAVDTYSTLKKRNEVARVTLGLSELVLITYCQLILLPIVRLPFVRTPLKVADHFSSKGVRLIEQAAPRLKERERPLRVNGELLLTAVFLPLTICIALARGAMEGVANRLVIAFPPLKEAARGFGQKNVLGQWITLLLMVYLYLPLQFVSHPGETLQQILAIPSKIAWAMVEWNIDNVMVALNELGEWMEWSSGTLSYYFYIWLGLVLTVADYWYYLVFKVTGLERYLRDLLAAIVAYLKKQEGTVAQLANSLAQTAPVQWMVDVFANSDLGLVQLIRGLWSGSDVKSGERGRPRRQQQSPAGRPIGPLATAGSVRPE